MLFLVTINGAGNHGKNKPPEFDPDHDPDPGGQPLVPGEVVELPFRRHQVSSVTEHTPHLRAA